MVGSLNYPHEMFNLFSLKQLRFNKGCSYGDFIRNFNNQLAYIESLHHISR